MTLFLAISESLGAFGLSSRETVVTELELSSVPLTSLSLASKLAISTPIAAAVYC